MFESQDYGIKRDADFLFGKPDLTLKLLVFHMDIWKKCNDPPVSAQLRPLKRTPRRRSSYQAIDAVGGGCRTGSSRQ